MFVFPRGLLYTLGVWECKNPLYLHQREIFFPCLLSTPWAWKMLGGHNGICFRKKKRGVMCCLCLCACPMSKCVCKMERRCCTVCCIVSGGSSSEAPLHSTDVMLNLSPSLVCRVTCRASGCRNHPGWHWSAGQADLKNTFFLKKFTMMLLTHSTVGWQDVRMLARVLLCCVLSIYWELLYVYVL